MNLRRDRNRIYLYGSDRIPHNGLEVFHDRIGERKMLNAAIKGNDETDELKKGCCLIVKSLDRLGDNLEDIDTLIKELREANRYILMLDWGFSTKKPISREMLAEVEKRIKERLRLEKKVAYLRELTKRRARKIKDDKKAIRNRFLLQMSVREFARLEGCSQSTLHRASRRVREEAEAIMNSL